MGPIAYKLTGLPLSSGDHTYLSDPYRARNVVLTSATDAMPSPGPDDPKTPLKNRIIRRLVMLHHQPELPYLEHGE